jgi:ABC-2 type transport system permease protein
MSAVNAAATPRRSRGPLVAQVAAEVGMTLRRGESVLLALGIPVFLLVIFSVVHVLPTPTKHPVDFLAPGVLALAVMSTSMVSLGIATGFERGYGVLKRLGTTPLGRPALLLAKTSSVLVIEAIQASVLVPVAVALGWRPGGSAWPAIVGMLLGTAAFAGLGLLMAGSLRAEATLAAANGLYVVLLVVGGMIIPLSKLPSGLRVIARALPAAALSDVLSSAFGSGTASAHDWIVLGLWALAAPTAAALTFRWE